MTEEIESPAARPVVLIDGVKLSPKVIVELPAVIVTLAWEIVKFAVPNEVAV